MAQLVKNLPAMQKIWVQSLDWEDPLKKGKSTHSSIMDCIVPGVTKSQTQLSNFHFQLIILVTTLFANKVTF